MYLTYKCDRIHYLFNEPKNLFVAYKCDRRKYFLRKIVNAINLFILYVNITKLCFVCICIKFHFSYFKIN